MYEKCLYNCDTCGRQVEVDAQGNYVPECCDRPMEKLEPPAPCQLASNPEHARPDEDFEPCDDGRSGRIQ